MKILSRRKRHSLTKSAAILNGLTPCRKRPKSYRINLCQSNLGRRMLLHNRLKQTCSNSNSLSRNLLTRIPIRPTLINHCRKRVNRPKYHTIQSLIKSLVSVQMKTTGTRSNWLRTKTVASLTATGSKMMRNKIRRSSMNQVLSRVVWPMSTIRIRQK